MVCVKMWRLQHPRERCPAHEEVARRWCSACPSPRPCMAGATWSTPGWTLLAAQQSFGESVLLSTSCSARRLRDTLGVVWAPKAGSFSSGEEPRDKLGPGHTWRREAHHDIFMPMTKELTCCILNPFEPLLPAQPQTSPDLIALDQFETTSSRYLQEREFSLQMLGKSSARKRTCPTINFTKTAIGNKKPASVPSPIGWSST